MDNQDNEKQKNSNDLEEQNGPVDEQAPTSDKKDQESAMTPPEIPQDKQKEAAMWNMRNVEEVKFYKLFLQLVFTEYPPYSLVYLTNTNAVPLILFAFWVLQAHDKNETTRVEHKAQAHDGNTKGEDVPQEPSDTARVEIAAAEKRVSKPENNVAEEALKDEIDTGKQTEEEEMGTATTTEEVKFYNYIL